MGVVRASLPLHALPPPNGDGPVEISWGKDEKCPAIAAPNTVPTTVGYRASCSPAHLPRSDQPAQGFTRVRYRGLPRASIPHGLAAKNVVVIMPTSLSCSCLRLTVASDRLRRGLAPPITHPCPAHRLRLRRTPIQRSRIPERRRQGRRPRPDADFSGKRQPRSRSDLSGGMTTTPGLARLALH